MAEAATLMVAERLASLGRAVVEQRGYAGAERAALDGDWNSAVATVPEAQRDAVFQEVEALVAGGPGGEPSRPQTGTKSKGPVQGLMEKCAGLELKLKSEAARYGELEAALRREQENHAEAVQSLSLQQKKIKELQGTRSQLMEDLSRTEAQLRLQITETEQVQQKYEKLKSSRASVGDQVTGQTEQINDLKAENARLREEYEALLREREKKAAHAEAAAEEAESRTAETALGQIWARLHDEVPTVFLETHAANAATFERVGDATVEMLRVFAALERHVHGLLRDLRQVGEQDDKLNRFYIILTKNPGLADTLRDYLVSGQRKGNFANLLRAIQAWARAFATGMYKVVVKSPSLMGNELNYRSWSLNRGRFETEEAAIGRYYRETAQRTIPEKLGTEFRKHAADEAYEDYNNLMRQR